MARKGSEIVDVEVTLEYSTDGAWLVTSHITGKKTWIPRSAAELDTDNNPNVLTLSTHYAEEKGLV